MADGFVIREYRSTDAEALLALVRDLQATQRTYFEDMLPAEELGRWYLDGLISACREANGTLFVVERDGDLIGYAALRLDVVNADEKDERPYRYAEIDELYIQDAWRGRGLGARLLAACEQAALDRGSTRIRISVLAGNRDAAKLYKRHGFDEHVVQLEKPLKGVR